MKPGMPFGGSCLPKDLRALVYAARKLDSPLPMFEAILASNRLQVERLAQRIRSAGSRNIALLGLSFKEGTDDLRESPLVSLAEILIGQGNSLRIVDPNVEYSALFGSNKAFLDRELPHIRSSLSSADEALAASDTLVFAHDSAFFREIYAKAGPQHRVIDLVGLDSVPSAADVRGLYW